MKIVVFGGGGFIGSAIVDRLLADRHSVRIFERPRVAPYRQFTTDERVQWIAGDFSSSHEVAEAVAGTDGVIHLVSATLPKNSNDDPIFDVQANVLPTLQLLNAMVSHRVPRILFISSGGTVYGKPLYVPIDESHPTNPIVSYAITKLTIEKYLELYQQHHGLRAISLRVTNPYGERQRVETAQGAVGVFLSRAMSGLPIEIWGDGSVTRDYIHVSDVAEAFAQAMDYSGDQSCFNISSGVGTDLNALVEMIGCVLGKQIPVEYRPGRPFDVPVNVLSNERAKSVLGWSPRVPIMRGLECTVEWMKAQLAKPLA